MKRLFIVGAGGFGREVCGWARQCADYGRRWILGGFLDDDPNCLDGYQTAVPWMGRVQDHQPVEEEEFLCAVGRPTARRELCTLLEARGARFANLIHPTVIIGDEVTLGNGVLLCPRVVLTTNIVISDHVSINLGSAVGHDARIGKWCQISSYCDITGKVVLGEEVFLGSRASILPGIQVGRGATVGAGSIVLRSVPEGATVFGIPARVL